MVAVSATLRALTKIALICAVAGVFITPANVTAQSCGALGAINNTTSPSTISANTPTYVVPLSPYQFTLSNCAQNWLLNIQCTVQFKNTSSSPASVTPVNLGIDPIDVAPTTSQYAIWSYILGGVAGGTVITGPFCAINSTQSGTATGSVSVIAQPQGLGGGSTVFFDGFDAFPSGNWVITAGSPVQSGSIGDPAPSVAFLLGDSMTGNGTFSDSGSTFSFEVASGSATPVNVQRPIFVEDSTTGVANSGEVLIDYLGKTVTYFFTIGGASSSTIVPFNLDTNFHTFAFSVDPMGNAKWTRDGVVEATETGFQTNLNMRFYIAPAGGNASVQVYFDNFKVTRS